MGPYVDVVEVVEPSHRRFGLGRPGVQTVEEEVLERYFEGTLGSLM